MIMAAIRGGCRAGSSHSVSMYGRNYFLITELHVLLFVPNLLRNYRLMIN